MNKTRLEKSIGWTDRTINPIKGMCKGGCWYCWTKPFYTMGRLKPELSLDCSQFLKLPKIPKRVFLCSTHDLFGDWISKERRDIIFSYMDSWPQHTFQILTKMPENIDRSMPENVWLGVSVTKHEDSGRILCLRDAKARIKFVSYEPILGPAYMSTSFYDWLILGRLTGHGKKYDPSKDWIETMVGVAKNGDTPLFMKNNLRDIWGEPLIQEFPE